MLCIFCRIAMCLQQEQQDNRFRERQSALRYLRSQHDCNPRWERLRPARKRNVQLLYEPNKM